MKDDDLIRALRGYARKSPDVNWQENLMLKEAANRLEELAHPKAELLAFEELEDTDCVWIEDRLTWDYCHYEEPTIAFFLWVYGNKATFGDGEGYSAGRIRDEYGENWRCWTHKPTDEQRMKTEWKNSGRS